MVPMKLYDFPLAYHPAKPRLLLTEKNINYQTQNVNLLNGETLQPWYLKINPKSTAPVLVADGKTITESKDIVEFIDSQGSPLGGDAVDRAAVKRWVDKCSAWDGNLYVFAGADAGTKGFLSNVQNFKLKVAEARKKENPDLASLYDEKIKNIQDGMVINPDAVAANDACLKDILQTADTTLTNQGFLAGDLYSLADVMFTVVLWRVDTVAGKKAELIDPLPNVSSYYTKVQARPSFAKVFGPSKGLGVLRVALPTLLKMKCSSVFGRY